MGQKNIAILTGAGISAESNLKTFRDGGGLWEKHKIEDVATPEAFQRNPSLVYSFYNARRSQLQDVIPNEAHHALTDLQFAHPETKLITQNVDDLHDRAGSKVIHMHGELLKMRCLNCEGVFIMSSQETLDATTTCEKCKQVGKLRPHIVWFGEMPMEMEHIHQILKDCHEFWAIGTSSQVYPAANFFQLAKEYGAKTVEMNLERTISSSAFDEVILGPATQTVPDQVKKVLMM